MPEKMGKSFFATGVFTRVFALAFRNTYVSHGGLDTKGHDEQARPDRQGSSTPPALIKQGKSR